MAKRPRFSRWRRLPGVFRTGENRPIDSGTELDRIILYVPARILDLAEALAEKAGVASVQDYCALLLMQALENERVKKRVAEFEARRGPLEGLKQIADDPHYLVEWQERSENRAETPYEYAPDDGQGKRARCLRRRPASPAPPTSFCPTRRRAALDVPSEPPGAHTEGTLGPRIAVEPAIANAPAASSKPMVLLMSDSSPQETLARHVGHGTDDYGFLPCLRRGEQVPAGKVAELNRALSQLEEELARPPRSNAAPLICSTGWRSSRRCC